MTFKGSFQPKLFYERLFATRKKSRVKINSELYSCDKQLNVLFQTPAAVLPLSQTSN